MNTLNINKALGLLDSGKYDALRELLVKHKNEEVKNAQKAKASKSKKRNEEWGASYLAFLRCYEEGISIRVLKEAAVVDLQEKRLAELLANNPNIDEDNADDEALKFAKDEITKHRTDEFLKQAKQLEKSKAVRKNNDGWLLFLELRRLAALPQGHFDELDKKLTLLKLTNNSI
jgi:hypothetical protein